MLLACIPVCTTFVALGLLALLVLMVFETPAVVDAEAVPNNDAAPRKHPRWWAFALIPIAIAIILGSLAWATAGN
jgi:hypothetical protein